MTKPYSHILTVNHAALKESLTRSSLVGRMFQLEMHIHQQDANIPHFMELLLAHHRDRQDSYEQGHSA